MNASTEMISKCSSSYPFLDLSRAYVRHSTHHTHPVPSSPVPSVLCCLLLSCAVLRCLTWCWHHVILVQLSTCAVTWREKLSRDDRMPRHPIRDARLGANTHCESTTTDPPMSPFLADDSNSARSHVCFFNPSMTTLA